MQHLGSDTGFAQQVFQTRGVFRIGDNGVFGTETAALRGQLCHLRMPGQRENGKAVGMARNHIECVFADAAGAAEDGEGLGHVFILLRPSEKRRAFVALLAAFQTASVCLEAV